MLEFTVETGYLMSMTLSGLLFLFMFLPISLMVYYFSDDKAKEFVLLLLSLFFYSICSLEFIPLLVVSIFITVVLGRIMDYCSNEIMRKLILTGGIVYNVVILAYYKYFDFAIDTINRLFLLDIGTKELFLPLGISFYSFKAISYLVDIYKNRVKLSDNPIHDALYLSFFAQIQSGPITRYSLFERKKCNFHNYFSKGVLRLIAGFNKKVLVANALSNITSEVFSSPIENISSPYIWLGSICFSLQLFFDFSGYSDMAIGISEMFGYGCMENFNYPYMADSVSDFWRRWHISLSLWFRDYIYIPLGGSRTNSRWRVYLNLFVVWILTGLWHGAAWNYVIWGLGYYFAVSFEKLLSIPKRFKSGISKRIYWVLSILFINFQWVFFKADGLINALRYIKRMIIFHSNHTANIRALYLLRSYWVFLVIAAILCFPFKKRMDSILGKQGLSDCIIALFTVIGGIWALSFAVFGLNDPFIYTIF